MQDDDGAIGIDLEADLALIRKAAEAAGTLALAYFRRDPDVWFKNEDRSPVSEADIAVDKLLREQLMAGRPHYGWLSEESGEPSERAAHETVFVVDPIDGTRGFIAGKDIWCVSVAVVHRGRSLAGVLVAPATGEIFAARAGQPAERNGRRIAVNDSTWQDAERMAVAAPERLLSRLPEDLRAGMTSVAHVPSLAYRLAMVSDGRLDAALVRENANDWDIAAAQVILESAGGALIREDGTPVVYQRAETTHGILLAGSGAALPRLVQVLESLGGH